MSCGGYYVFAQICSSAEQNQICCEEEIVKNGDIGFKGGEIIQSKLQNCTEFIASHIDKDLTIKLEGWNELTVSQFNCFKYNSFIYFFINSKFFSQKNNPESICPVDLEIHLDNKPSFTASFEDKRVKATPKVNLYIGK